ATSRRSVTPYEKRNDVVTCVPIAGTSTEPAGDASVVRSTMGSRWIEVERPKPNRPTGVVLPPGTAKNVEGPALGQNASLSMHVAAAASQSAAEARVAKSPPATARAVTVRRRMGAPILPRPEPGCDEVGDVHPREPARVPPVAERLRLGSGPMPLTQD